MNRLEEIRARHEAIRARLAEIEALAEPDGDEVTRSTVLTERTTETDTLLAEWDTLEAERVPLQQREDRLAVVRSRATVPGAVERGAPAGPQVLVRNDPYEGQDLIRAGAVPSTDLVARARNAIEAAPAHMNDTGRARATELVEMDNVHAPLIARHMLLTGSPAYHEQFREYIATRGAYAGQLLRAALSLTDANGGFLVPFTLDPTIILTNAGIADPIRSIATVRTIATDNWNGVTSAGVTAEWLGEAVEAADASPTFGQPTITPKKAAAWVFGSYEALADTGFQSELGRLLADAKARLEGAAFATGNTGATVPRGVVAATAAVTGSIVSSAAINAFTVGEVYRVANALRPRDAAQASWIANKAIFNLVRQFDTSGSAAYWANLGMGRPQELLGQPVYECSTMTNVVTTSGLVLLAGNFSQYYVIDRVGMSVLYEPLIRSTGNNRPTGQAGWFAFWRVGADVVDPAAFRLLQLHTNPTAVALG